MGPNGSGGLASGRSATVLRATEATDATAPKRHTHLRDILRREQTLVLFAFAFGCMFLRYTLV